MIEHQRLRSFAFVSPGLLAFGLDEVLPRFRSHLLHAGLALLADATRAEVVAVATYGCTIHLGLLSWLMLSIPLPFPKELRWVCGKCGYEWEADESAA